MSSDVSATSSPSTTPPQPYTILRIKRKRNEEPLDALVVETIRRKKSRGLGVFQYAETVEDSVWDNAERRLVIRDKISRLAKQLPKKSAVVSQATYPTLPLSRDENLRRYTVVDRDEVEHSRPAPSQILSPKDLNKQSKLTKDFKLFDAIPSQQAPVFHTPSDDVDKFLPLLNDYLRIHHINTNIIPPDNTPTDDYVWDVFYHRPATLSEWNSVAVNIGKLTGLPSELDGYDSLSDTDDEYLDEADEDSNAEEYYKNDYPDEDDSDGFFEDSDYDRFNDDGSDDDFY